MNKALVIIDAQEDFTRGALVNDQAVMALEQINRLVEYARRHQFSQIVYTMDTHDINYLETQEGKHLPVRHCIRNTHGWALCPEAACEPETDIIIYKPSFGYKDWEKLPFEDLDEIVICGFCTDICVMANFQIIKAAFPEVPIVVIMDACAGSSITAHYDACNVMTSCHADVMTLHHYIKTNG